MTLFSRGKVRVVCGLAVAVGLVLVECECAQGGPRVRDEWQAIVNDDLRYGSEHTRVVEMPDGNFRYTAEQRALIDLLGQKQEVEQSIEVIVTPDYQVLAIKKGDQLGRWML